MVSKRNLFRLGLLLLFILAAAKGVFELGSILLLEAQGPLDADSTIYFTLGRTILNGFQLYTDFFDVQPPGIFLLTATSLFITGDERLTTGFVVFIIAALPASIAWFAFRESRHAKKFFRTLLILLALSLGILLTLYLEERAPTVETQLFGAFFGVLFTIVMIRYPDRFEWKRSAFAGLLLLGSIGMKEPFLLTNLAAALLLARDKKHFLHAFLLPLGVGGVLGVLILFPMGILIPYIRSLGTTFAFRSGSTTDLYGPMILRPLATGMLHKNMSSMYAASPLLAYLIWFLWSRSPAYRAEPKINLRRPSSTVMLMLAFGSGALFMAAIHSIMMVRHVRLLNLVLADPLLLRHAILECFLAILVLVLSALWFHRRRMLPGLLLSFAALALTSLGVGSSMYAGNHFAFAIPAYAAVILLFLHENARRGKLTPAFLTGSVLTLLVMFLYTPNPRHLSYLELRMGITYAAQKERIEQFDQLMDSCGWEQYYNEALMELAMAKHSPFGPLVLRYDYMPVDHPLHVRTAENILKHAQLLVTTENYEDPDPKPVDHRVVTMLREHIPKSFTKDPPPCALPFVPIDGLTLWFRKDLPPKGS